MRGQKQNSTPQDPNPHAIKRSIQRRVKWLYAIFSIAALLVFAQLVLTQYGPNGNALRNLSEERCYTMRTVRGSRGNIYDHNGEILSTDSRTYTIRLDLAAGQLADTTFQKYVNPLADSLGKMFGKGSKYYRATLKDWRIKAVDSKDSMKVKAKEKGYYSGARYRLLARHLNQKEYDRLCTFPLMERKYGLIPEEEPMRYKVYGSMAAYTISQGVEKAYDSLLSATDGVNRYLRLDARNRHSVPIVHKDNRPAQNGMDIITTIDVNLQDVVEGVLRDQIISNNDLSGTAVVVECATGEIRAMANLSHRKNGEINDDFNYAIRWHSAPGSTFKAVSLMALLDKKGVSLNQKVDCGETGHEKINGMMVKDTHVIGNKGQSDVKGIFVESSNVGFAKLITENYKEKPEEWVEFVRGIGFEKVSNIQNIRGLGFHIKHPSSYRTNGGWSHTTLPQTAYGYEVNMTPMQILMFYNAVANDGVMVAPMLVKQVVNEGVVVEEYATEVVNPSICSPQTLAALRECMEEVVSHKKGTANKLNTLPFAVAGKTGTAQVELPKELRSKDNAYKGKDGTHHYLATFVGYFPAENPKYSCIVSVKTERKPDQTTKPYTGSGVAVPVFGQIAEYIYTHDKEWAVEAPRVMAQGGLARKTSHKAEFTEGMVPDVVGMGLRDALYTLESAGMKVEFKGKGAVVEQTPAAGSPCTSGDKVVLRLNSELPKEHKKQT